MSGKNTEQKSSVKLFSLMIIAGSTAILIAVPVMILSLLGLGLDTLFHTKPIFLIIGAIAGFLSSMVNIQKMLQSLK